MNGPYQTVGEGILFSMIQWILYFQRNVLAIRQKRISNIFVHLSTSSNEESPWKIFCVYTIWISFHA